MDEIAKRRAKKLEEEKLKTHTEGEAVCLYCWHQFETEVPIGRAWIDCPHCKRLFARFKGPTLYNNRPHWHCLSCQGDVWRITPDGAYCIDCGKFSDPSEYS